jgi:hypothetical protein
MKGGFFAGAVGGLAIALMLVGLVSVFPQANPQTPASTASAVSGHGAGVNVVTSTEVSISDITCPPNPIPPYFSTCQVTQITSVVTSTNSTCAPCELAVPSSPPTASGANAANSKSTIASQAQQQGPASLLASLPGEGVGGLLVNISPLLIGLLVAAMVYGAYVRRQDASS